MEGSEIRLYNHLGSIKKHGVYILGLNMAKTQLVSDRRIRAPSTHYLF